MTILDLIKAACKTKGVPEKYAERIQKTFKIEKAEGMEAFVDLFKENILQLSRKRRMKLRLRLKRLRSLHTKQNMD